MNKAYILETIETLLGDLVAGKEYTENDEPIPWDEDGWEAMIEALKEVQYWVKDTKEEA